MSGEVYVAELVSSQISVEGLDIVKDIWKEAFDICKCNALLESIAFASQHVLFFYGGTADKTYVLNILSRELKEYSSYRHVPEDVVSTRVCYLISEAYNVNEYKFIALLLKLHNNNIENIEERKKIIFAINFLLCKEVFNVEMNPFYQRLIISNGMDLPKCMKRLDDLQREHSEKRMFSDDLYSYCSLKDYLDRFFCDKFKCVCVDAISTSEEDTKKYYGVTQKIIKEGGKVHFGQYDNITLELANYNHIYQIVFKVSIPESSWRTYIKRIEEMEYNAKQALLIGGVEVDIDFDYANEDAKKTVVYWVSKVKKIAESMKAVTDCENGMMVWIEAFYCKNLTIDTFMERIKQVYERFNDVIVYGIDMDFDCFSEEYRDILESYKGCVLPDVI